MKPTTITEVMIGKRILKAIPAPLMIMEAKEAPRAWANWMTEPLMETSKLDWRLVTILIPVFSCKPINQPLNIHKKIKNRFRYR